MLAVAIKNGGKCQTPGCQERPYARDLCRRHYDEQLLARAPRVHGRRLRRQSVECRVLSKRHYRYALRHGEIRASERERRPANRTALLPSGLCIQGSYFSPPPLSAIRWLMPLVPSNLKSFPAER
jgi:hypothetical protein